MKRIILILLLLVFLSSLSATRAWILPSKDGEISKIVDKSVDKILFERKVSPKEKGVIMWLLNTDGGGSYSYLSGIEDVDTFLNWFQPATDCSLLAYYITNSVFIPGATNDQFTMFMAELDQTIDYVNDYDEYHGTGDTPGPNPVVSIYQSLDTFCYGFDSMWTEVTDTLINPVDNGTDIFGVGWVKVRFDSSPNPNIYVHGYPPYHTLMHREGDDALGWYSSWHCCRMMALVNYYKNPQPIVMLEDLPDSYETGTRSVIAYITDFGIPPDSSGTIEVNLNYQVNGGSINNVYGILVSGDSADGYWKIDIPGTNAGDTVDYWTIATDYQGVSDTTLTYSYILREGTPGHFLWVENDYTEVSYPGLFQKYSDIMDFWDYEEFGPPDSSVIAFYANGIDDTTRTVIWKDWGCIALGEGVDYGAGIYYSDTSWIKMLLDNGGNFWLSDQDQGYGTGVAPNYGQVSVPAGHWVREYLGIQGLYDDTPGFTMSPFNALSNDTLLTDLFIGIGFQDSGRIYIAPYGWSGGCAYCFNGSFDSLMNGSEISMYESQDTFIIAYRYGGPSGNDYKVFNTIFPFDNIAHPDSGLSAYTTDEAAVDTLIIDILEWFGIEFSGLSDRTIEPDKIIKLFPAGIVTDNVSIKFYLPEEMPVKLSIYDLSGRLIKNIVDRRMPAGLNTVRWNADASNGVYFYRLETPEKIITEKMVVLR